MAWENRNGNWYYYRKRREGRRVISEYVGAGSAGKLAEMFDGEDLQEAAYKRRELLKIKQKELAMDDQVKEVDRRTRAILRACLLLAGYHAHKGQWRKRRGVTSD